jgi:hypothetical protein
MAMKTFYVTRDMKHPLYRTRMLRAGDQLELDGPTARLYRALNAVSDEPPAKAKVAATPPVAPPPAPTTVAAPKRKATRKRTAKKAK